MDRLELISAEVERTREVARRKADEGRRELASRFSVKGLGRSSALLKALLENDVTVVEATLAARVDAEDRYPPTGSSLEQGVATDDASSDLRSIVESEMSWLEARVRGEAERMGLPGSLDDSTSVERERLLATYERELRIRAERRQRASEPIPYFPDVGVRFYETGRFHVLEAADVATEQGLEALFELLYEYPEHEVYVFLRQDDPTPAALTAARENGGLVVTHTEDYYYKHPHFQLDYVSIRPGNAHWDWERDLVEQGPEFRRLRLKLSERERVRRAVAEAGEPADYSAAMRALWVLESAESDVECVQGTAFSLSGVGVVTCHHVLRPGTTAFPADAVARRRAIKPLAQNEAVDLAVLQIEGDVPASLEASTREPRNGESVVVLGFPNYRLGDTGVVNPGTVSGWRTVGGVRRLLLAANIVAGMSGGPVLDSRGEVIAVAVTGADRMSTTRETEDQSAIPIDALEHLGTLSERN